MARRSFEVVDVTEILIHWYAGRSKAEVARSLGVDRKTVRGYVAVAEEAGLIPGGPPVSAQEWAALVRRWYPELVCQELRSPSFAEIAKHHEVIKAALGVVTLATIFQRLRDEKGLTASLASVRRYVRATMPEEVLRAQVTPRLPDPEAGEQSQIDYGYLGRWTDPIGGQVRRVWAFVMVLASSRHLFVYPVFTMTLHAWINAHVAAFEFFGGAPRALVIDNLKAGVIKPDLYDPKMNRTYAEFAAHYGVLIDPARAAHPKDKPRVERMMPYVRDSFWAGRDFTSEASMVEGARIWSGEIAGRRRCRPLGGAMPIAVFEATEKALLLPLPARAYLIAAWSTPKVAPDAHVSVAGSLYSVPWRYCGRNIDVRATETEIACYADGELVKTHVRVAKGRCATDWADYPPEKVAFMQRTPVWCRRRAAEIGEATATLITELLTGGALHHLRAAQGILALADKHTSERVNLACAKATAAGDPSYRTVKGILVARREADTAEESAPSNTPAHLRGPDAFDADAPEEAAR